MRNAEPLVRAIVEAVVFFGMADDEVIHPDVAVSMLEEFASILQGLAEEDKLAFVADVKRFALDEESRFGRTERVEFLLSLASNLGLEGD